MNDHVIGIVLKQSDYKDHAVLLSVLTEDYGKISFIAAGARKITSKNSGFILPYAKDDFLFDYREGKSIFRMKTAVCLNSIHHIYQDLIRSSAAGILCEATDAVAYDNADPDLSKSLFHELDAGLTWLENGENAGLVIAVYLARVLDEIGMGPSVDGCAVCGKSTVTGISVREGGFLCAAHAHQFGITNDDPVHLRQFRLLAKAHMDQIPLIREAIQCPDNDARIFSEFLRMHAGIELKSMAFYNELISIE